MPKNNPKYLIIHHTGGTDAHPLQDSSNFSFSDCDKLHKDRFNFKSSLGYYVGYHYFIDKAGLLTQARNDTEEGAHTIGYNTQSIGICLAGNFDVTLPTEKQIETLKKIILDKQLKYFIPVNNIIPHRSFANKSCYGKKLDDKWAQKLVHTLSINKHVFSFDLELGQINDEVKKLQSRLQELGYFPQTQQATGCYGDITRASVFNFQRDYIINLNWLERNIYKGRYFGQKSRAALNRL